MATRLFLGLFMTLALATSAPAQFYAFGPRGFAIGDYPPVISALAPYPPSGVRIRSPFFQMDLSPYGGHYITPYSSFSIPNYAIAPPSRLDSFPRGLRDFHYGPPIPELGSHEEFQSFDQPSIMEPAPVPPPQYDIPSFSDVFPDNSPSSEPAAVRIAGRIEQALERLSNSLQKRDTTGVWSNYLRLEELSQFSIAISGVQDISASMLTEAESLLLNFDAVAASPELAWLKASPGFEDIRTTLRRIVQYSGSPATTISSDPQSSEPTRVEPVENEPQFEDLPAPIALPLTQPASNPASNPAAQPVGKSKRVFRAEL